MTLIFATCEQQPLLTADDQVLADELSRRGLAVDPVPWTEIDPFAVADAPPILLRSTWDYHRIPTMFSVWLEGLRDSGRLVWNDPAIALGNIDKAYLRQLQAVAIEIPPTVWIDRPDEASIREAIAAAGWSTAVLKPRIAATAYGTFLITADTDLAVLDLAPARASGALLQEFVPEIADGGETSMIYCDGRFSHAVVKRAKAGDFRVQKDFGGSVELIAPSADLQAFADRVMATVPSTCLYARVDVVSTARGPLLMELELIEPELFFLFAPAAAATFATALSSRLS